jgi:hypothetical protein
MQVTAGFNMDRQIIAPASINAGRARQAPGPSDAHQGAARHGVGALMTGSIVKLARCRPYIDMEQVSLAFRPA